MGGFQADELLKMMRLKGVPMDAYVAAAHIRIYRTAVFLSRTGQHEPGDGDYATAGASRRERRQEKAGALPDEHADRDGGGGASGDQPSQQDTDTPTQEELLGMAVDAFDGFIAEGLVPSHQLIDSLLTVVDETDNIEAASVLSLTTRIQRLCSTHDIRIDGPLEAWRTPVVNVVAGCWLLVAVSLCIVSVCTGSRVLVEAIIAGWCSVACMPRCTIGAPFAAPFAVLHARGHVLMQCSFWSTGFGLLA